MLLSSVTLTLAVSCPHYMALCQDIAYYNYYYYLLVRYAFSKQLLLFQKAT